MGEDSPPGISIPPCCPSLLIHARLCDYFWHHWGQGQRSRVTHSESLKSCPTKKIPQEVALAAGHDFLYGESTSLEERIKAIVIGNQGSVIRHPTDLDMKNLDIQDWIFRSFVEKNSVKGDKTGVVTKGNKSDKEEVLDSNSSGNQNLQVNQSNVVSLRPRHQLQDNHGSRSDLPKTENAQNRISRNESRTVRSKSSHIQPTNAQTRENSCQRKISEPAGHSSGNKSAQSKEKQYVRENVGGSNITDAEKLLHKLRSTSLIRHKSLYNPVCNGAHLLPNPQSERGRSDEFLVRSPRSKSEPRIVDKNPKNFSTRQNEDYKEMEGELSSKSAPAKDSSAMEKPKSPHRIVRKKSSLSRNKTDLFRAAKERPGNISRLKEKFAKFSAAASQRKLSNQLSITRRKSQESSKGNYEKELEKAELPVHKELSSPSDVKTLHLQTLLIHEANHSSTSRENEFYHHPTNSSKTEPSHLRTSSAVESHNSRTSKGVEPNHARAASDNAYYIRGSSRLENPSAKEAQQSYRGGDLKSIHSRSRSYEEKKSEVPRKTSQPSMDSGGHLIVRQCLIGTNLAFGLVQLNAGPNGNSHTDGHGLVTIRMRPDDQGRFGFNVKGGADQGMPIIVSRVAPGTPADIALPRLNEGDQVLFINGRDVSQHTHEQVVMFIRASRETHSGELVLIVRPNVYVGEEQAEEEPFLEYLPEHYQIIAPKTGTNGLEASLMLLQESLDSGAALAQFEQLYRKKPGMTMNAARLEENIAKNRYRDISPYDQTRVILKEQNVSGGDYINANYVNMEIPGSGIVNRYIAAQGPLPKTCTDFWQMVWEQHSSLVVMLTTKVEKGRVKCHQYWPEMYETMDYGLLQITCVKEEETSSFAFREFNLTHVETSEERHISHMQYIAWPDHNVPDDPADFLEFVLKVRQRRMGMVEPTIVHCSAGIGRTGVLITMETAMCLIEANQPVYPLSIVRQMRDQRAMLIQTATQYKFVCEAILKVYNEELVKPLEDFAR
uniref:Tyrosine-protein phosphatase non-receptor type 4-like isoform X6 n=1 Tax=Crassostrea virginica TaxID=6565 RepID=A0A8B8BRA0_CRAVI|nr:tyrosine-protein phosphatase non-receptor type 4-like isoform X6 [Crassostrea virginica]